MPDVAVISQYADTEVTSDDLLGFGFVKRDNMSGKMWVDEKKYLSTKWREGYFLIFLGVGLVVIMVWILLSLFRLGVL